MTRFFKWVGFLLGGVAAFWAMSQLRSANVAAKRHEQIEEEHKAIAHRVDGSSAKALKHGDKKKKAQERAKAKRAVIEKRIEGLREKQENAKASEIAARLNALD